LTKHYSEQEIETYRRRMMPPLDTLVVNEHLARCEECYDKFHEQALLSSTYDFARTDLKAAEEEEPEHLSFEQILAYLDNELDAIEHDIAGAHMEICSDCDDICRDLRLFKSDLASGQIYVPRQRSSFQEKLAGIWHAYRMPIQVFAGGGAAAAVIGFLIMSHQNVTDLQAQLNRLQQQKNSLQSYDSAVSDLKSQLERLYQENKELKDWVSSLDSPGLSAKAQVVINDMGGRVELDDRGTLNGIAFVSPDHQAAVIDAIRTGRIKASAELSYLLGEQKRLMGSGNRQKSFIPIKPVGAVIATTQPTFRWKQVAGATGYTVTIYRNNLKESISSQTLTGTQWTAPPLTRGATYSWQIRAIKDNSETISPSPDAREARFRVLSQSEFDNLEKIRESYSKSHLALGVIYARMGLFDEAEREFRALLADNPGSNIVKQLLRSVTSGPLK
jgi:tetratricopeptide (TPR) repeat protein